MVSDPVAEVSRLRAELMYHSRAIAERFAVMLGDAGRAAHGGDPRLGRVANDIRAAQALLECQLANPPADIYQEMATLEGILQVQRRTLSMLSELSAGEQATPPARNDARSSPILAPQQPAATFPPLTNTIAQPREPAPPSETWQAQFDHGWGHTSQPNPGWMPNPEPAGRQHHHGHTGAPNQQPSGAQQRPQQDLSGLTRRSPPPAPPAYSMPAAPPAAAPRQPQSPPYPDWSQRPPPQQQHPQHPQPTPQRPQQPPPHPLQSSPAMQPLQPMPTAGALSVAPAYDPRHASPETGEDWHPEAPAPNRRRGSGIGAAIRTGALAGIGVIVVIGLLAGGFMTYRMVRAGPGDKRALSAAAERKPDTRLPGATAEARKPEATKAALSGAGRNAATLAPSLTPAAVDATEAAGASEGDAATRFVAVLSTHREFGTARQAFAALRQRYAEILAGTVPDVQAVAVQDSGTWHRLTVLPALPRHEAQDLCRRLKEAGHAGCWIKPQ